MVCARGQYDFSGQALSQNSISLVLAKKVLVLCWARDTIIEKARNGSGPEFNREIPF
jgi:hypothetical protein